MGNGILYQPHSSGGGGKILARGGDHSAKAGESAGAAGNEVNDEWRPREIAAFVNCEGRRRYGRALLSATRTEEDLVGELVPRGFELPTFKTEGHRIRTTTRERR